jgi:hypothetical protein
MNEYLNAEAIGITCPCGGHRNERWSSEIDNMMMKIYDAFING